MDIREGLKGIPTFCSVSTMHSLNRSINSQPLSKKRSRITLKASVTPGLFELAVLWSGVAARFSGVPRLGAKMTP